MIFPMYKTQEVRSVITSALLTEAQSLLDTATMSTFIIIIFPLLMMGKSGGAIRPVVTFTPNWGNVLQGDNVTLRCELPSSVPEEPRIYHWYKDGRTTHRDEQILQIKSSEERDSGDYQCRINTDDISDPVTLNVTNRYVLLQRPPSAIYEGDPLTLRCHHIKDFIGLQTRFYKNNEEIKSEFPNSEFRIQKVDLNTAGHYKCSKRIAFSDRSDSYEFSDEFPLSVKGGAIRPEVTFTPNWGNVLQGDDVTLRCDVPSTVPLKPRTYHWYKDGRTIPGDEQILQIKSSAERDSGDYQCRINTGDISDPVTLNVTIGYVLLQRPPSAIYEGDPLTLRCHHNKDFSGFQTIFYKNNEEIKSEFPDSEFSIQKVDLNTAGHYKCSKRISSRNSSEYREFSDEFSHEVSVSVKELFSPPKIKVTPSRVIEGDEMTVRCDTRLDPLRGGTKLHFAFYRDGRTVRGYNVSDTYRVRSSQLEDSGKYTCEVRTRSDTVWKMSDGLYIQMYDYTVQNITRLVISGFVLAAALCFTYFHNKW